MFENKKKLLAEVENLRKTVEEQGERLFNQSGEIHQLQLEKEALIAKETEAEDARFNIIPTVNFAWVIYIDRIPEDGEFLSQTEIGIRTSKGLCKEFFYCSLGAHLELCKRFSAFLDRKGY